MTGAEGAHGDAEFAQALVAGDQSAWSRFFENVVPWLERCAFPFRNILHKYGWTVEDVTAELVTKIYKDPHPLLEPVARGERPLYCRLRRALRNLCYDLLRRGKRQERCHRARCERSRPSTPDPTALWQRFTEVAQLLLNAGSGMLPAYQIINLLRARTELAVKVRDDTPELLVDLTPSSFAAQLLPWTTEQASLSPAPRGRDVILMEIWAAVVPWIDNGADCATIHREIEAVIGVSEYTFYQWRKRARDALWKFDAERCLRLLPHWAARGGMQSPGASFESGSSGPQGGRA